MTDTVFARIDRDVVVVSGPDASSLLQSLLSQDLAPVAVGESAHALLLQPQGKLVVDLRALHLAADEWWCVCERGFGATLAAGLIRFRVRAKAEIEDRSEAVAAVSVRGSDAIDLVARALSDTSGITVLHSDWANGPGVELVGEPAAIDDAMGRLTAAGATEVDEAGYEALRIEAGVPRQGYDIDETTIAQEAFLELDAVSFTKGCFVGQELVCRIDSRGHVNRLLRRLRSDVPLARGSSIVADGKEVGAVTSVAGNVALATIRRAVEAGSEVVVRAPSGDVTARVEAVVS